MTGVFVDGIHGTPYIASTMDPSWDGFSGDIEDSENF